MKKQGVMVLAAAALLAAGPALAEKPAWAGGGKEEKHERKERGNGSKADDRKGHGPQGGPNVEAGKRAPIQTERHVSRDRSGGVSVSLHFGDRQRTVVREYFVQHYKGACPPGLAKKGNGCMPPGQAKKWVVGRPLPRDVIFYDLPPALVIELGTPPAGHRFVRVAADILLIAIGTGMVIDAIEDLGRL